MPTGTCHLERPFHAFLPFYIGKIEIGYLAGFPEFLAGVYNSGAGCGCPLEEPGYFAERAHAIDVEIVDHRSFGCVGLRNNHPFHVHGTRHYRHREHTFDGQQRAVERQFPHYKVFAQVRGVDLPVGREHTQRYREVVGRAFLTDIGRRHVDHHFFTWEFIPALAYSRDNAFGALFHCRVGQPDHDELYAVSGKDFDGDWYGVNPLQGCAAGFYEHDGGRLFHGVACRGD